MMPPAAPSETAARPGRAWRLPLFPLLMLPLAAAVAAAPDIRAMLAGGGDESADRGYSAVVNRIFAPMNWLEVNERDPGQPGRHVVDLSAEAVSHAQVIDFYVRSPLLRDIAADNEGLWTISGRNVRGLDPAARVLPQPFAAGGWTGDILYSSGSSSVFLYGERDGGRGLRIEIRPLRSGMPPAAFPNISVADDAPDVAVDQQFQLVDERALPLAVVRLIGRRVVVFPNANAQSRLTVDTPAGATTARYDRESGRRAFELAPGGLITVARNDQPLARYRLGSAASALSSYRPFVGRSVDPAIGALGRHIEAAFLASGTTGAEPARLALDRNLHQHMQIELERFVATQFGGRREPIRAAALAMNTMTGEVLSLASYTGAAGGTGAGDRPDEERNNNLAALLVGSVAKVPVSAAILSQHPDLIGLRIDSRGAPFRLALGIDMEGAQVDGPAGPIDFRAFLRRSSNLYATWLMLMALSPDPLRPGSCPSEAYWLGGAERRRAPDFLLEREPRPCGPRFAMPVSGPLSSKLIGASGRGHWIGALDAMFDLPGVESPPTRYDTSLWPNPAPSAEEEDAWNRAFRQVSPDNESFGLGAVRQFHNDYINLILGGVHSRWTTVKVAEVFSRVVTGRRIEASFLRRPQGSGAPGLGRLDSNARAAILDGLRQVVEEQQGTAFSHLAQTSGTLEAPLGLARQLASARGEEIRIFAKTGTPTVPRTETVRAWVALRGLEARRLIILVGGELRVAGAGANEGDLAALRRHGDAEAAASAEGLSLPQLAAGLESLRREVRGTEIRGSNNHLMLPTTRVLPQIPGRRTNGGVLALVIGRYCRGAPATAPPQRAVTLIINFQIRGDSNPAGQFARRLLQRESPILRRLFETPIRCRRLNA